MKDANIERPAVSEVKVTVESDFQGSPKRTIFEFYSDEHIHRGNFNYQPLLKFPSPPHYQITVDPNFPSEGENRAEYVVNGRAFDDPNLQRINVQVENGADIDNATFQYFDLTK